MYRYSGSYDTDALQLTHQRGNNGGGVISVPPTTLSISNSLSAISSLTNPAVKTTTGAAKFDLTASTSAFLTGSREGGSNRDSIAVVEDNRQELERLVEQINSDLTSAQQQNAELSPKTPVESTINQLLASKPKTSTDNPGAAAAQSNQITAESAASAADPSGGAAAIVSDEESLKILLTKPVKHSPVTDLDVPTMPDNPYQSLADHKITSQLKTTTDNSITLNSYTSPEHDESACGAVTGNDITVNDVLDQVGEAVDETILLSIDEEKSLNTYKSEKPAPTLSNKKGLWIYLTKIFPRCAQETT